LFEHLRVGKRSERLLRNRDGIAGRVEHGLEIRLTLLEASALSFDSLERGRRGVGRARSIASHLFSRERSVASLLGFGTIAFDFGEHAVALGLSVHDRNIELRKFLIEPRQAVGAHESLGGGGAGAFRDETIPSAQAPLARHQPLPDRQRLAPILIGDGHLPEAALQFRRGGDMRRERFRAGRKGRVPGKRFAAFPPPGVISRANRSLDIFAQGRSQGALVSGGRPEADDRAGAMFERAAQRVMFRLRGRQGRPRRSEVALSAVALLRGGGPAVLGLDPLRFRGGQSGSRSLAACLCLVADRALLAAVAKGG
jgi:hypothetical protein